MWRESARIYYLGRRPELPPRIQHYLQVPGNLRTDRALGFEKLFRGGLEHLFSVRPRTKELIGHPLLVLFFLSLPWRNRLTALLALAGLLGQVSILNTFCHLHTPLALTLHREGLGLGIGLISAALWGALALAATGVWERLRAKG